MIHRGARSRESNRDRLSDRGVSDVLGFVVVFGVVAVSITLMYTFGLGALDAIQHGEAMENSERAFDILADNMADIHNHRAPGRSTELQFGGGQLSTTGQVDLVVNVTGGSNNFSHSYGIAPIAYHSRETGFHYVSGAVVRTERDAAMVVNDPPFTFTEERVVLSVVDTKATGETASIGGGGTIRVTGRGQGQSSLLVATDVGSVNVSVTSPRHRAWARYFKNQGCDTVATDQVNDTVTCEFMTDEVYLRRTAINVELSP